MYYVKIINSTNKDFIVKVDKESFIGESKKVANPNNENTIIDSTNSDTITLLFKSQNEMRIGKNRGTFDVVEPQTLFYNFLVIQYKSGEVIFKASCKSELFNSVSQLPSEDSKWRKNLK